MTLFRYSVINSLKPVWFILALGLVLLTANATHAQETDDVVRTSVSLVQLNVGVVDKEGRAITSLTRNDFAVFEDGVRQSISQFEPTNAPFSLVLLLDVSGSTINFRPQLKLATQRFLDALAPEDRVAVIQFNARTKKLIDFSTNRNRIAYAIELAEGAGETHFYDALKYALKELEKEGKRRKAIVVLTDGLDTEMRNVDRRVVSQSKTDEEALSAIRPDASAPLTAILNAADRQGVTIYPLALPSGDPKRLPIPGPDITGIYAAARTRLQSLASRTGGRLTEINRLDQMAKLYAEVAADLLLLYTVAYQAPPDRPRDGKWHDIRVEVTSFSRAGVELPYASLVVGRGGTTWREWFDVSLRTVPPEAEIPVERINGPVMFVSGTLDGVWPCSEMADAAIDRLRRHRFAFPVDHAKYEDAGHAILMPPYRVGPIENPWAADNYYQPHWLKSGIGSLQLGGTSEGNRLARMDAWPRMVRFLREHI